MVRTAGDLGWAVVGGLAFCALVLPIACDDPGPTPTEPVGGVTLQATLDEVWPAVLSPELDAFDARLSGLDAALVAWRDASGDGAGERLVAQEAWVEAMESWQRIEPMQIGPLGASVSAVGGQDLRDAIYSWPITNPCRVDQETAEQDWDTTSFFEENLVNSYGLDAAEHLLYAGPDHACPSQLGLDGDWDAFDAASLREARAGYALAIVEQARGDVAAVRRAWEDDGFALDAATYGSDQAALNGLYDALFYLETGTKDRKLAEVFGARDCTTACEELAESRISGTSHRWIVANLEGFQTLFGGGDDGDGLDGFLRSVGHTDLADRIDAALTGALNDAAAVDRPLDVLAVEDPERATQLLEAVKQLTDLLKGDLVTVLSVQVPQEASGDND